MRRIRLTTLSCAVVLAASAALAQGKPNILLILSDDVGPTNVSAYGDGIVGFKTRKLIASLTAA